MTPEEKAKALIDKFYDVDDCYEHYADQPHICSHQAKQCALIAVDEILYLLETLDDPGNGVIVYWKSVKKHIQSL